MSPFRGLSLKSVMRVEWNNVKVILDLKKKPSPGLNQNTAEKTVKEKD